MRNIRSSPSGGLMNHHLFLQSDWSGIVDSEIHDVAAVRHHPGIYIVSSQIIVKVAGAGSPTMRITYNAPGLGARVIDTISDIIGSFNTAFVGVYNLTPIQIISSGDTAISVQWIANGGLASVTDVYSNAIIVGSLPNIN